MQVTYASVTELAAALRRAAEAHARHEQHAEQADPDWPRWNAQYPWHEQHRPRSPQFAHLPERVDPKDTVASQAASPARDPESGRDTERDFLLRYGAGGDDNLWDITDG